MSKWKTSTTLIFQAGDTTTGWRDFTICTTQILKISKSFEKKKKSDLLILTFIEIENIKQETRFATLI